MDIRFIDPLKDIAFDLLKVEKPARYSGGEYGRLSNPESMRMESTLKTLIAFPDLYEIGMSNQALRIIYNQLNNIKGISCDRAFAPAPDFEELLKKNNLPLYGLDTGISLKNIDILMFTLPYELLITGIFSMLDISGIPLYCSSRGDKDPVIIMGGPCVSNPLPYCAFADAFWIGEAEGGFFRLAEELREIKKQGGNRKALLDKILSHPSVWAKGKGRAVKAIDNEFSERKTGPAIFPIPSMKVVHNHGAVEIMRGCPNGCRFCHAGYWYRPMRQKNADIIMQETEAFIRQGGYREITLSSLSSGDYKHLDNLIDSLNDKYKKEYVSFQLPSLKVSGFSLNLLEKISEVRKSGLTFAVETPLDYWQMMLNKQVLTENIVSILLEAKKKGWKLVKFYFMIGLPLENNDLLNKNPAKSEEEEIVKFIENVSAQTKMRFNINIGTFVPKAHTPFQWAKQISRFDAENKLNFLRFTLKKQGHKIGIQDPLISVLEGLASRGDERAGEFFLEAFKLGSRLEAWTEFFKRDIWEDLLNKNDALINEICCEKEIKKILPWNIINSGVNDNYFYEENQKSSRIEMTLPCINNCNNYCGICNDITYPVQNKFQLKEIGQKIKKSISHKSDPDIYRILFSFSKEENAIFHSHLSILEIFSMAFKRAGIPVKYTQGFNPLPKLEIVFPVSIGVIAKGEMAIVDTDEFYEAKQFINSMNLSFPQGLKIINAKNYLIPTGVKKHSISSLLWGFIYNGINNNIDYVKYNEEKKYRQSRIDLNGTIFGLERLEVLARDFNNQDIGASYFDIYNKIYNV